MSPTRYTLEVNPVLPARLARLEELANNLYYSWDREVQRLFYRLDPALWGSCGHNPKVFLRRVAQHKLESAAADNVFVQDHNRVLSSFDAYLDARPDLGLVRHLDPEHDLVAYFCAEFGFHESFPIYSGGLGILAGDYCKAASDLGAPLVAVGLLYHQGYFTQTIDGHGQQIAHSVATDFADLPIRPARTGAGEALILKLALPGRDIAVRVWEANAGHVTLYLLDSDLPENNESDRAITHQLYGGDINTRIQQEIVLGIGGVRALRLLGLRPKVWHINEGHAAFQVLERCRLWAKQGLDFESAREVVAASTVFTTHTPVPAGHDIFSHDLMRSYFKGYVEEQGITMERFLALGTSPTDPHGFNQTALALRCSRFHNGVSKIHGEVASRMERYIWPELEPEENPISHVTNGVHLPTFLASEWANLFDMRWGGGWRNQLLNDAFWDGIDDIPEHGYWSLHQSIKSDMLEAARETAVRQHRRNGYSESLIERLVRYLHPSETDILTFGFARRFATYKRAALLFTDAQRLARLVNDPQRPVAFIFTGKAHPHDQPGQDIIRTVHEFSRRPEFEGKIILLEGYDLALGRKLVTGVDVWLNNPEPPLEASGTSGQKAGINGVINVSVSDGWWAEGYDGKNGWTIKPADPRMDAMSRNREEATELLDIIEHQVIPLYYAHDGHGYSRGWIQRSRASMKSLIPRFNAQRMVMDYVQKFYAPAKHQRQALAQDGGAPARELAAWKQHAAACWPNVSIRRIDNVVERIQADSTVPIDMAAKLDGLDAEDVVVECVVGTCDTDGKFLPHHSYPLQVNGHTQDGETLFHLDLCTDLPGLQSYQLRIYPYHKLLSHRFELGLMRWL